VVVAGVDGPRLGRLEHRRPSTREALAAPLRPGIHVNDGSADHDDIAGAGGNIYLDDHDDVHLDLHDDDDVIVHDDD
jgi:hypothetical protein